MAGGVLSCGHPKQTSLKEIAQRKAKAMIKLRNKLFLTAAATIVFAAIQPAKLSAQTSGVGSDGYTRVLWRATDGSISLWRVDANLLNPIYHVYGPYNGWTPLAITTGLDNYTRVLWRATDGSVSLWLVDPNLNYVNSVVYGPYYGWIAESLSIDQYDRLRLIWRETSGEISIWILNSTLGYVTSETYGPYFGYDPGVAAAAKTGSSLSSNNTTVTQQAPDSMKLAPSTPIPPPQQ